MIIFNKRNPDNSKTFDFLGFTYYVGKSRKGFYITMLKTSNKKYKAKIKEYKGLLK